MTYQIKMTAFIVLLLIFLKTGFINAQEPTPSASPTQMSSYELFWPVVAGKVPGDPLYFLKSLKAAVGAKFIFNDLKKADFHLLQSKKRLVEAEKLLIDKKDYAKAESGVKEAKKELEKSMKVLKDVKRKKKPTGDLHGRIISDATNEANFMKYLAAQIPEDKRS